MKTRISILLIVVGLLAVSCDNFLDVNTDPNNPTEVTPDLVLPVALDYTASYVQRDRGLNHLGNMMMFNFGEAAGFSWYNEEFAYQTTSTFYDAMFDNAYSSALKQYHVLTQGSDGYYKAIGNIMKAYHYQILVDLYGDIPYSEALERGQNATPVYDDASAVYDDLLTKLTGAISTIDSTANTDTPTEVGEDDTVYGGDMEQWKRFANTLKIRILSRLSSTRPASFINDQLTTIQNSGVGYIDDDVTIDPGYLVEADKQNPYWATLGQDEGGNETLSYQATPATQFVVDFFQGTGDPRIDAIFEEPGTGHSGVDQGAPNDDAAQEPPNVSNLEFGGGVLKSATMPSVILLLAEHEFNLAELAERGLSVTGSPQAHYEAGITASFEYLGLTATDASNYYTNGMNNVEWAASTNKMDAIMTQQWLGTLALTAEQAWFDYNRTGYPSAAPVGAGSLPTASSGFPISLLAGSHNDRPVRLAYPASEITRNNANKPDQPDTFTEKIFWAN